MSDVSNEIELHPINANTDRMADGQDGGIDTTRTDLLRRLGLAMASGFMPRTPAHRGGALFLIGAGCSRSAGVPLGWEVAGIACAMMAEKLAPASIRDQFALTDDLAANENRFEQALKYLKDKGHLDQSTSLGTGYSVIFERLFSDQSQQNEVIGKALAFGRNQINWAHICLGQLVHERYVHTVLTTNFDTLILDGIVRCGTIPAVSDSLDTINRIRGKSPHPQLVHLHGSRHAYSQYNKSVDLTDTANRDDLKHMIAELLRDSTALIVVGYAGGEEAVMQHVAEAVKRYPDKPIFWVTKSNSLDNQSEATKGLLNDSDKIRKPRHFMGGWDADDFFRSLMQELGVSLPHWMLDPVQFWKKRAEEIVKPTMISMIYENTITSLIDDFTRRLQRLEDCQSRSIKNNLSQTAENIRQNIASGNVDGALSEIKSAKNIDVYKDTLIELLTFISDKAKSSENYESMENVLWFIDKIHQSIENAGAQWTGAVSVLSEIYRVFVSFPLRGYPEQIQSHAVQTAEEGLQLRLKLAEQLPEQFTSAVADGWHQLSNRYADIGELEKALEAIRKAVSIREELMKEDPNRFSSDLAVSLNNLSIRLAEIGDQPGALNVIRQAVNIQRRLASENPARFSPDFARSLNNLSIHLAEQGDKAGALNAIRQAVGIYRELANENPTRFNADLAMSLHNLSIRLAEQDNGAEALDTIRQVVDIRRRLASENPARFSPDLAMSLHTLSNRLADQGDKAGALDAIRQAVDIRRGLANQNPARFNSELSVSLEMLARRTYENGYLEQAIRLTEEAIALMPPNVSANPNSRYSRRLQRMQRDLARYCEAPTP